MILPSKYENVSNSSFVLGGNIIRLLLDEEYMDFNTLYLKLEASVSLTKYMDVLTFLFFLGIIEINNDLIRLKHDT